MIGHKHKAAKEVGSPPKVSLDCVDLDSVALQNAQLHYAIVETKNQWICRHKAYQKAVRARRPVWLIHMLKGNGMFSQLQPPRYAKSHLVPDQAQKPDLSKLNTV